MSTTRLSRHFAAPPARVYAALVTAADIRQWMVPDGMTGQVHQFEPRVGGRFRLSLTYESPSGIGKTDAHTDSYHGRFVEMLPHARVVETMAFETDDPTMQGEMTLTYMLQPAADGGTDLVAVHAGVPPGIRPEDNEAGWRESLDKLARLVEP